MYDVVLILNHSRNEHKALVQHYDAILIIKIWADNHSCSTRFIFQSHKNDSLRSSGALARDHTAGSRGQLAMRKIVQFDSGLDSARAQNIAPISHRMVASG